ncbi:MAG: hypothetical protein ACJ8G3_17615 [Burkholderiaceae bacterium]
MTKNAYSLCNELSLSELDTITAGKDGEMFAGEYGNSGKQVGTMTLNELRDFYKSTGLSYHITFGRTVDTITVWNSNELFSRDSTYFIPRT